MPSKLFLVSCLALPALFACDKGKGEGAEGETVVKGEGAGGEAGDESAKQGAEGNGEGGEAAQACDAKAELSSFLDVFAAGDADAVLEKVAFPFSGDTGNWIEDEEEIRKGIKAGGKPFESLAINPFEESTLAERNKTWLEEVRGKYPDVIPFDVIATRKESHTKMSAYWFVDPETCKVVGMDDY